MRRSLTLTLASAISIGFAAAGCGGDALGPPADRTDADFEVRMLETVGIAEDQANGSSVVPLSALGAILLSAVSDHGTCTYSSSTGRFTCPDVTRDGIKISRSFALFDAANKPQDKRDTSTAKINTQVWARGTARKDHGMVTIDRKSDLTATGIQRGSPSRTLNGTEQGTSTMEQQTSRGKVTSAVVFGDTTIALVVPNNDSQRKWPLSGTVIRSHSGTRTIEGHAGSISFSRRAVFVYDGSAVVKITVTSNGETKSCTLNLETREHRCTS